MLGHFRASGGSTLVGFVVGGLYHLLATLRQIERQAMHEAMHIRRSLKRRREMTKRPSPTKPTSVLPPPARNCPATTLPRLFLGGWDDPRGATRTGMKVG